MKKAEIIKNGNVNVKSINTKPEIDWYNLRLDFEVWKMEIYQDRKTYPMPSECFNWLFDRIS